MSALFCSFCDYRCHSDQFLLKHLRDFHENDPNFQVNCSLCGKSYKKWCSLKKHLHRIHSAANVESLQQNENSEEQDSFDDEWPVSNIVHAQEVDQQWESTHFLLHATEEHSLTHSGVDSLCESTQRFVDKICSQVSERIEALLPVDVDSALRQSLLAACKSGDLFTGLTTRYSREKYYCEAFNYVEPTPIVLGTNWEWTVQRGQRKLVETKLVGYVVDLFAGLKALLSNPAVRHEIENQHVSTDNIIRDFCDGQFVKNHAVFTNHPNALHFIIYYDDIEVANPLGAKAGKHKLGVFYYTLGNIRPVFRSCLQAIQLIAVAKTSDIRLCGFDGLIQPFIDQVNVLGKDKGYCLQLRDEQIVLHGVVVALCGDTPASCYVGEFKEGVGFSLRKCRTCMAILSDMSLKFHATEFIARNKQTHAEHLKLIAEGESRDSTTYGINCASPLQELIGFDVTKCLPFDVMHTLFEGVVSNHLNLLFHHLIDESHSLCLGELNHAIDSHDYGYSEADTKPSPIHRESTAISDFKFKQPASQMMTLVRLLPIMIGKFVEQDDDHWECFLLLWDICSMVCAFEVTKEEAVHLMWLTEIYLEAFINLYTTSVTPKMHYLVHLLEQILVFGPLRQHWCMRFESKNAQIKRFVKLSFRNVPLTVSIHHQQWMCYHLSTRPNQSVSNFFYSSDEIVSGSMATVDQYVEEIISLCGDSLQTVAGPLQLLSCSGVKIHGVLYKCGSVIRIASSDNTDDLPFTYAQIKKVYVHLDRKIFVTNIVKVSEFVQPLRSLNVVTEQPLLCLICQLICIVMVFSTLNQCCFS